MGKAKNRAIMREDWRKAQGAEGKEMPRKKFYRQRAHANPFSDHNLIYPPNPDEMDWSVHYPAFVDESLPTTADVDTEASKVLVPRPLRKSVEIVDIGCGFGGLLVGLAPLFPDQLLLGVEIRSQVTEFVQDRIRALRAQNAAHNKYQNIACIRGNTMKFLPNFFKKAQLSKIFICFPDPHFKTRKHKQRIVSTTLCSEYAFVLRPGGIIYTITDVESLHEWMVEHLDTHPAFERIPNEQLEHDDCVKTMKFETEESKKVGRNNGHKLVAVYRRLEDPPWSTE